MQGGAHSCCCPRVLRIQLEHNVSNSILFKFKDRFLQYLRATRENDPTLPVTFEDLAAQAGVHFVVAGGPDNMRGSVAVPYRPAVYVAGDLSSVKNALLLLDGYFLKEVRDEMPVHLHPHTGIDVKDVMEDTMRKLSDYPTHAHSRKRRALFDPPPGVGI